MVDCASAKVRGNFQNWSHQIHVYSDSEGLLQNFFFFFLNREYKRKILFRIASVTMVWTLDRWDSEEKGIKCPVAQLHDN